MEENIRICIPLSSDFELHAVLRHLFDQDYKWQIGGQDMKLCLPEKYEGIVITTTEDRKSIAWSRTCDDYRHVVMPQELIRTGLPKLLEEIQIEWEGDFGPFYGVLRKYGDLQVYTSADKNTKEFTVDWETLNYIAPV